MNQLTQRGGLLLARFALSAWVGAAVLFVINGVRLITHDSFDSAEKDAMALIRFPAYYLTGALLMASAILGLFAGRNWPGLSGVRWVAATMLTGVAAAILVGDYLWIYSPLAAMITPPGSTRPAEFEWYHHASEMINSLQVALCCIAAVIISWPLGGRGDN